MWWYGQSIAIETYIRSLVRGATNDIKYDGAQLISKHCFTFHHYDNTAATARRPCTRYIKFLTTWMHARYCRLQLKINSRKKKIQEIFASSSIDFQEPQYTGLRSSTTCMEWRCWLMGEAKQNKWHEWLRALPYKLSRKTRYAFVLSPGASRIAEECALWRSNIAIIVK